MAAAAQASFAELEYGGKKRKTRREKFLERMERLVPWKELEDAVRPHYPKTPTGRAGGRIRCRRCCGCIAYSCSTT